MTRVTRAAASAHAVAGARSRNKVSRPNARKHKIILESVTQEKKKLRSVISFQAKAPPGYTFIPAGNPHFTNACKEICRRDGLKVYMVTTTPHHRMHNLSQQVHRVGCHFPSVVVATVCMERGFFLSSTGKIVSYNSAGYHLRGRRADSVLSQNTINVEARDAIKDLFPNIPEKDLSQIIKTAFQKGRRKVGTAVELPLARRVQLAVVAHIRHVYTDYDRLLKVTSFPEARSAIEQPCLAKLVQWRGDDENGSTVLEDVFREVIVISDDEDDEDESDTIQEEGANRDRDSSIEFVSSNTFIGEIQTRPIDYGKPPSPNHVMYELSEDDTSSARFISQHPRKRKAADKNKLDRRGFSRYEAWHRAQLKYKGGGGLPTGSDPVESHPEPYPLPHRVPVLSKRSDATIHESDGAQFQRPPVFAPTRAIKPPTLDSASEERYIMRNPLRSSSLVGHGPAEPNVSRPPDIIRLPDGSIFERAVRPPLSANNRISSAATDLNNHLTPYIYEDPGHSPPSHYNGGLRSLHSSHGNQGPFVRRSGELRYGPVPSVERPPPAGYEQRRLRQTTEVPPNSGWVPINRPVHERMPIDGSAEELPRRHINDDARLPPPSSWRTTLPEVQPNSMRERFTRPAQDDGPYEPYSNVPYERRVPRERARYPITTNHKPFSLINERIRSSPGQQPETFYNTLKEYSVGHDGTEQGALVFPGHGNLRFGERNAFYPSQRLEEARYPILVRPGGHGPATEHRRTMTRDEGLRASSKPPFFHDGGVSRRAEEQRRYYQHVAPVDRFVVLSD